MFLIAYHGPCLHHLFPPLTVVNPIDNSSFASISLFLVPVGRGLSDGLTFPVNPRFDEEGRWRSRADWPEELR